MTRAPSAGPLLVRLPEAPFVMPESCACCGAPATTRLSARPRAARDLPIGYCADCASHVARTETRRLAARLSALLLGAALALSLPILWPWSSLASALAITLAAVLLPLAAAARALRPEPGHAASGPAATLHGARDLVCLRPEYAREICLRSDAELVPAQKPRGVWLTEIGLGLALAGGVAWLSHAFHHPIVRVVNLGDGPIAVFADGHALGLVEPTSAESPLAGLEARVPAGPRRLVSRAADGSPVAEADVQFQAGTRHLYAPLGPDTCFFLERTAYGREHQATAAVRLEGSTRFWTIPPDVQGWFVKSPPPGAETRATGGTTTVLRQAPCSQSP